MYIYVHVYTQAYLLWNSQALTVSGKPTPSCAEAQQASFWYFSGSCAGRGGFPAQFEPDYSMKGMLLSKVIDYKSKKTYPTKTNLFVCHLVLLTSNGAVSSLIPLRGRP